MRIKEDRRAARAPSIDQRLIDEGIKQLSAEIEILTDWLNDKDNDDQNPDTRASYQDMLQSRQEMLLALQRQRDAQQSAEIQRSARRDEDDKRSSKR